MRNRASDDRVKHYAATEWRRGGMVRVANHGGERETLNQVLAGILKQVAQGWSSEEYNQRSKCQQFGLLWFGALVFTWPLFMLHFGRILRTQFSGSGYEELGLFLAGFVTSAALATLPAWLAMSERKGQTKVRLFLTGFLLPYVVVGLLLPLLQTKGGAP